MTSTGMEMGGEQSQAVADRAKDDPLLEAMRPQATGNTLVVFDAAASPPEVEGIVRNALAGGFERAAGGGVLGRFAQLDIVGGPSVAPAIDPARDVVRLYRRAGVAVIERRDGAAMQALEDSLSRVDGVVEVRPEFYLFSQQAFADTAESTWGLKATGVDRSPFTGKGIKLAILDTGLDEDHPDFTGRTVIGQNFVGDNGITDIQGHGTHCAGVAAGPRSRGRVAPGYGCAPDAELYVGKVLNDSGSATEGSVAAGIEWAIEQGCHIVSMSLGRSVRPGEKPTLLYENLGKRALDADCLLVAAAGNSSRRYSGFIAPVNEPANSANFMAVAAIGPDMEVAYFSSGGINPDGGDVDLAAPGVSIFSSFPRPRLYETLSGTSMACAHVAGIAALWAEADPQLRGLALWKALVANAKGLPQPSRDVGAGLAQAPQARRSGYAPSV